MKSLACSLFLFLSVFTFDACKNDLKLDAPYKEIPSIYAVLNPQDRIQIIRINKVFMGQGNANQMAQVADSINYPAGELSVTLTRTAYGEAAIATPSGNKSVITFRDSMLVAEDGAFNKTQRVYVCSDKLFVNGDYHLTVKNNRTGNMFTATATSLDSINGNQGFRPLTISPLYPFPPGTNPNEYIDYYDYNGSVRFVPNEGQLYQLIIRLHFYDSLYSHQKNYSYVDYVFGNKNLQDLETIGAGQYIDYSFRPSDLFGAVGISLSQMSLNQQIIGRKMYKIQFFIYSTTQDYVDYLQFVSPSLSITQNKPLYSNFDNQAALGLFTFRARCSLSKSIATSFVSEFAYNSNTCAYRFFTASGALPGCN